MLVQELEEFGSRGARELVLAELLTRLLIPGLLGLVAPGWRFAPE